MRSHRLPFFSVTRRPCRVRSSPCFSLTNRFSFFCPEFALPRGPPLPLLRFMEITCPCLGHTSKFSTRTKTFSSLMSFVSAVFLRGSRRFFLFFPQYRRFFYASFAFIVPDSWSWSRDMRHLFPLQLFHFIPPFSNAFFLFFAEFLVLPLWQHDSATLFFYPPHFFLHRSFYIGDVDSPFVLPFQLPVLRRSPFTAKLYPPCFGLSRYDLDFFRSTPLF